MGNPIAPYFIVVLFSTLLFLVAVPQETVGEQRVVSVQRAVSLLNPFVKSYLDELRGQNESDQIKIRVWMHNGDPHLNGCGLFFLARAQSDAYSKDYFPDHEEYECGNEIYRMRMMSPGGVYDKTLYLSNETVKDIEVHSDGWSNTFINVICVGLTEGTIPNGPRAFCINNQLLKGCKSLLKRWNDVDIDWDDLMMTRTPRGAHKVLFYEVEKLLSAIERLEKNSEDTDAMFTVCDRMVLLRGEGATESSFDCPAAKVGSYRNTENLSPYGCNRHSSEG